MDDVASVGDDHGKSAFTKIHKMVKIDGDVLLSRDSQNPIRAVVAAV